MHPYIRAISLIAIVLTGCSREPTTTSPPQQRQEAPAEPRPTRSLMLSSGDGTLGSAVVQDIPPGPAEPWKWVYQRPAVRLRVVDVKGLKYRIEFVLPEATFKQTGPVTLRFLVNGRELGKERYAEQGEKEWEAPVPPDWLKPSDENILSAEVDKVWVSPTDGARLGFVLKRIGLAR